jgi:hypothetical protein
MVTFSRSSSSFLHTEELHSGDRLSREEFHRLYSEMPEGFRAELIGGIVYVASPLKENQLRWFNLVADQELAPDEEGLCRLATFPGLWIHAVALLSKDHGRMMAALEAGLSSSAHAGFVKQLSDAAGS